MRIDVIDIVGLQLGVPNGVAHYAIGAIAVFRRRADVMGVARHAVSHHLGDDARLTALGPFQLFQNQHARAFPYNESIAILVPGAASPPRRIVAGRKRPHGAKSADPHGGDTRLGAAADHHIGVAVLNESKRIANSMRAGSASRGYRRIRPLRSSAN